MRPIVWRGQHSNMNGQASNGQAMNGPAIKGQVINSQALSSQGKIRGLLFTVGAILIATGLAVALEALVKNYNLVLVYVLAVVVTGLRYGHWFAILAEGK